MASPIVCVLKKDNSIRLTCDFHYVNKYTVPNGFPMQNIDEVKLKVGKSNFIGVFNARSGYWQIKVCEEDQWLTAFSIHDSLYEWTRVLFGMKNSGATFVTAIQMILKPIKSIAESYVDDMAVHSGDWHTHLRDIKRYLTAIRDSGLMLNHGECKFGKNSVKYVGHIIGSGRHEPDPERVQAEVEMQRHTTKKQTRQVLGMFGFFRSYIPDFSTIAKPLTVLVW